MQQNDHLLDFENASPDETPLFRQHWTQMLQWKLAVSISGWIAFSITTGILVLGFVDCLNRINRNNLGWASHNRQIEAILMGGLLAISLVFLILCILSFSACIKTKKYPIIPLQSALKAQFQYWRILGIGLGFAAIIALSTVASAFYIDKYHTSEVTPQPFPPVRVLDEESVNMVEPMEAPVPSPSTRNQ